MIGVIFRGIELKLIAFLFSGSIVDKVVHLNLVVRVFRFFWMQVGHFELSNFLISVAAVLCIAFVSEKDWGSVFELRLIVLVLRWGRS